MNGHLRRVAARAWNPPSIRSDEGITPLSLARLVALQKAPSPTATDVASPRGPAREGQRLDAAGGRELAPAAVRRDPAVRAGRELGSPSVATPPSAAPAPEVRRVATEPRGTREPDESAAARVPEQPAKATSVVAGVPRPEPRHEDPLDTRPRPAVVVRREAPARPGEGRRDRRPDPIVVRISRVELTLSAPTPAAPATPPAAASSRPVITHPDLLSAHRSYRRGSGT